jgi:cation diffusion facilitator CzcD-associated flavoprotein CzcO
MRSRSRRVAPRWRLHWRSDATAVFASPEVDGTRDVSARGLRYLRFVGVPDGEYRLVMVVDVAVIGSGFGGLGAAIRLKESGISGVVIFERASDLGGTWRDNSYPGCRCDVASNLYSFSFAPNPDWTNTYSYQPEIWRYLQNVATQHRLRDLIKFDHNVEDVSFEGITKLWRLSTNHGEFYARCVVVATGGLAEPRLPDIKGIDDFEGPIMHTARWNDDVELANKRVGVIGTGASAIQVVPEIAPKVRSLVLFQRTPSWVLPHVGQPIIERTKKIFAMLPLTQRLNRAWGYWRRELLVLGFVKDPRRMTKAENLSHELLALQISDETLREKLTPQYRLGCKRVLISNDFYPALTRDNVALVTDPIVSIEANGVRTADGTLHELDVLIAATGFFVTDNPMASKIHGANGEQLCEAYRGKLSNYLGTTFPGFANLFMLGGPNTALGHSSVIFMLESQLNYVTKAISVALATNSLIEPKEHIAARWTRDVQGKLSGTVWDTGCSSWYLNEAGENTTIWPDFTFKYRSVTRHFDSRDHQITSSKMTEVP